MGLATHIIKWGNYEVVRDSAISGSYFENFVISEMKKSFINSRTNVNTYYYRDKDKKEVDFIYEKLATLHLIEIKKTTNINKSMIKSFDTVKVVAPYKKGSGAVSKKVSMTRNAVRNKKSSNCCLRSISADYEKRSKKKK